MFFILKNVCFEGDLHHIFLSFFNMSIAVSSMKPYKHVTYFKKNYSPTVRINFTLNAEINNMRAP